MKLRLAVAAAVLIALPLSTSEAFIFRRWRANRQARISSSSRMRSTSSRRSSAQWNVEGRRNYSADFIRQHLLQVHKIDASGLTVEQMEGLHDDMHNGLIVLSKPASSCPGGKCPTSSSKSYSSGGCPGGKCPTNSSRRWRFRR